MKPQPLSPKIDLTEYENKISNLLSILTLDQIHSNNLSPLFSDLITGLCFTIGGEYTAFDGFAIFQHQEHPEKITFFGEIFWLDNLANRLGSIAQIDIAHKMHPMLYSFKAFDNWTDKNQTLYIARNPDGWSYAINEIS